MTDKNTIKNWFKTTLKPPQEQFWAWMDSYWHKSESIPQGKIEGLADTLGNKADASQLAGKADLIDGKVPEKQLPNLQDNTKLNKPENDGNWIVSKTGETINWVSANSFGKNMANSQVVTTAESGVTQGANYTWDTAGYYFNLKNLPNKSNDATFDKVVVQDSNGQVATSSNAQVIVNAMKKMSDAQKDQYRTASLKTNEQYSIGQPIVSGVFPKIISRATSGTVSMMLYGRNLFINNVDRVSKVDIINIETQEVVETISNIEVHQTMPSNLSFELDKSKYTNNKKYTIQVTHNGLKSIIDSTVWFQIIEEMPQTNDVQLNWTLLNNSGRTEGTRENNGTFNFVNKPNDRFEFNLHTREDNVVEDGILNVYTGFEFEQNKSYYLSLDFYIKDPDAGDYSVNAETLSLNFLPKEEFITDNNVYYTKGKLLKSGSQGGGTGYGWHACAGVASETYGGNVYTHTGGYFTAKILIQKGRAFVSLNEKFYDAGYIPSVEGSYVLVFSFRNANAIKNNNEKQVNLRNVSILEIQ